MLRDVLAAALDANRELARLTAELREENERLRAENAEQAAELGKLRADLAVLQRMVFGRSSERSRPEPPGGAVGGQGAGTGAGRKRGPGARAGRRDYSHLPRFEVFWDFPGGGYCCPECGEPFTPLGDHWSGEQLDWQVIVRVAAHCRRRYKRACDCRVPGTVMAPGPPKAVGKGLFTQPPARGEEGDRDPQEKDKAAGGAPHVLIVRTPDGRLTWLQAIALRRKEEIAAGIPAAFTGSLIIDGYTDTSTCWSGWPASSSAARTSSAAAAPSPSSAPAAFSPGPATSS